MTSILLAKVARNQLEKNEGVYKVLEIGCGNGNIIRSIALEFRKNNYYASDISEESILEARQLNKEHPDLEINFEVCSGLEKWKNMKFDLIICDISAINEEIANLSDWYIGVKCETGDDGLKLIKPIIENIKNYLNTRGYFILPTISLSNTRELEKILRQSFRSAILVESKDWPMPKDLVDKIRIAGIPGRDINWKIRSKFGIEIANTGVYQCQI